MKTTRARRHGDRGVIAVFFAISISVVMVFVAVALGGSTGYSAARNAQNTADAASSAATARLRHVALGQAAASEVALVAAAVAEDNGAAPGTTVCEVVTADYAITNDAADVVGPCNGVNEVDPFAAGVRVTVTDRRSVPFGAFVDDDDIEATARAAATVQPVRTGRSPFMLCTTAVGHPVPVLLAAPTYEVNPVALGQQYVLWGSQIKNAGRDCGNGSSSWRGLVAFESTFAVPSPDPVDDAGWWEIETGNTSGKIDDLLAGANVCGGENISVTDLDVGCQIGVPACTHGNGAGGSGFRLHCVRFVTFEITYIGKVSSGAAPCHPTETNTIICGELIGHGIATDGATGSGHPSTAEVVAIRLVE